MSIKFQPLRKKSDQSLIIDEFSKFGECSFQFSVNPNQPKESIVTYDRPENASEAYSNLSDSQHRAMKLDLELLSSPAGEKEKTDQKKLNNSDIEISIPAKPIPFLSVHSNDLTPTSYYSPFFPDLTQSSIESSRSSRNSDNGIPESPISVTKIGNPNLSKTIFIKDFYQPEEDMAPISIPLPVKRQKEPGSYLFQTSKESDLMFHCDLCNKTIKKKSLKAHYATRLHQNNKK